MNDCHSTVHWFYIDLGILRYDIRVGIVRYTQYYATILIQYHVLRFSEKSFHPNIEHIVDAPLFIFFSILNNPVFQVIGRKASEVAEMAVKVLPHIVSYVGF
jgi:hypothetical protein